MSEARPSQASPKPSGVSESWIARPLPDFLIKGGARHNRLARLRGKLSDLTEQRTKTLNKALAELNKAGPNVTPGSEAANAFVSKVGPDPRFDKRESRLHARIRRLEVGDRRYTNRQMAKVASSFRR